MSERPDRIGGITVCSCVGGGPMERLVRELARLGVGARVVARHTPERWRQLMAGGRAGSLRARLGAMLAFPAQAVWDAVWRWPDVVVPTTNPFFLPLAMVLARPLHGRPVVALLYDLYPDVLEAAGVSRGHGLTSRFLSLANRVLFRCADGVVFIGSHMADHTRARYGEPKRWTIIETGADVAEFRRPSVVAGGAESDLERWCEGKRILSYVGNLGRVHDWATLAEGVRQVILEGPRAPDRPVGIVVAASGPGVAFLEKAWSDLPGEAVRFEPPLPDRAWARLLDRTDVALVTLRVEASRTSIPSKTFSAMAAGCAVVVVAPSDSDVARVVTEHGCGKVVEPGDVDGLVAAIEVLATDSRVLETCRAAAIEAMERHYDMAALARRWLEFLGGVARSGDSRGVYEALKRCLDLSGGALGLLAASPLLAGAAVAIRLTMGSPVLFRQQRPGQDGRPFHLVKFRTMRARRPGEVGAEADAARITPVGRFLRRTSLDELPTLWNVLKGEMSLVGPRPLLMRYLERYTRRQARRHEVKPGVTGWAQVNGRNALSWGEKFEHDVWYVDHRSLRLDLQILFRTALSVLRREGISQDGHATMPEFTGSPTSDGLDPSAGASDDT